MYTSRGYLPISPIPVPSGGGDRAMPPSICSHERAHWCQRRVRGGSCVLLLQISPKFDAPKKS